MTSNTPRFRSAVLIGASGGIGRALMDHLLDHSVCGHLVAVNRHGNCPASDRVTPLAADYDEPESLELLASAIANRGHAPGLILVATGVLHSDQFQPEKALRQVSGETLARVMYLNAIGPLLALKALLPLIPRRTRGVAAALSARVGSIGDNRLGGWYAYRASKAALNMMLKCAAIEAARLDPTLTCIGLHPGTVDTGLSAPYQANTAGDRLFSPQQAAAYLCQLVSEVGPERTGEVIAWDGQTVVP